MTTFANGLDYTKRHELLRMRAEIERLREENERLAALAYRDPLTGLRNRRVFSERLNEELSRVRRNPSAGLSVIVIDVNGFKTLNDTVGHAAGDRALRAVGAVLETLVRTEDLVCRVGGDEFVVLLPNTNDVQAMPVVERLRANASALVSVGLAERPLAIGVATWRDDDDELSLLARADAEMYADKRDARSTSQEDSSGSCVRAA